MSNRQVLTEAIADLRAMEAAMRKLALLVDDRQGKVFIEMGRSSLQMAVSRFGQAFERPIDPALEHGARSVSGLPAALTIAAAA